MQSAVITYREFFPIHRLALEIWHGEQTLMKPINHVVNEDLDVYWLTDGTTRYEYQVAGGSPSAGESPESR